jgi:mevalonate pyrophosphate decarboxylase
MKSRVDGAWGTCALMNQRASRVPKAATSAKSAARLSAAKDAVAGVPNASLDHHQLND